MSPEDKRKVGGSDVAAVLGLSRYGGPLAVYGRIVHGVEKDEAPAMSAGKALEPVVLAEYARSTGRALDVDVKLERLPRPWLRASLDALSCVPGGPLRVVEGKTGSWRVRGEWGKPGTDEVPREYMLQVQYYLGVALECGAAEDDVADVPAFLGGEFSGVWHVRHCPETYGLILQGLERFWRDNVEAGVPPEPTALSSDAEYLKKRWPTHEKPHLETAELGDDALHCLHLHRAAVEASSQAEKLRDEMAGKVKMLLGDAAGVLGFADGSRLDWKTQKDGKRPLVWRNTGDER